MYVCTRCRKKESVAKRLLELEFRNTQDWAGQERMLEQLKTDFREVRGGRDRLQAETVSLQRKVSKLQQLAVGRLSERREPSLEPQSLESTSREEFGEDGGGIPMGPQQAKVRGDPHPPGFKVLSQRIENSADVTVRVISMFGCWISWRPQEIVDGLKQRWFSWFV